mgnify:CR=1 FL=1
MEKVICNHCGDIFIEIPKDTWKTVDPSEPHWLLKILNPAEVDNVCSKCEDNRKDQKILGMVILKDMVWDDDQWDDGTILDPKNGSVYDCKIWLEGDDKNKLYVRGYIGFFFRTQNWYRITE